MRTNQSQRARYVPSSPGDNETMANGRDSDSLRRHGEAAPKGWKPGWKEEGEEGAATAGRREHQKESSIITRGCITFEASLAKPKSKPARRVQAHPRASTLS